MNRFKVITHFFNNYVISTSNRRVRFTVTMPVLREFTVQQGKQTKITMMATVLMVMKESTDC